MANKVQTDSHQEIVPIRSVKQYMREFIYEGMVKNGAKPAMVREQLLDAFQKEVFGQLMFKYRDIFLLSKDEKTVDEKTREGVRNILDNANRKWKRLCIELARFKETHSLISPDDLMERLKDVVDIQESEREAPEDQKSPDEVVVTKG